MTRKRLAVLPERFFFYQWLTPSITKKNCYGVSLGFPNQNPFDCFCIQSFGHRNLDKSTQLPKQPHISFIDITLFTFKCAERAGEAWGYKHALWLQHPEAFEVMRATFRNVHLHRNCSSVSQEDPIPLHGIKKQLKFDLILTYGCKFRKARKIFTWKDNLKRKTTDHSMQRIIYFLHQGKPVKKI